MPSTLSYFVLFAFSLISSPIVSAAPARSIPVLVKRQSASPVTVVTVNTIQGATGPITQTCTVTLTPITANGQAAFREESSCTEAPSSSNNNNSPAASSSTDNSVTTNAQQTTATNTAQQTGAATTSGTVSSTDSASATQQTSTGVVTSGLASPTDVSVIGPSSAPTDVTISGVGNATPTPTSAAISTGASTISSGSPAVPTDVSVLGPSSMDASSASAAAALISSTASSPGATGTTAAFAIPGKQIQVLPIGLGVFAGVSVIALIVVGLVTYERTKYRKKFRKDKMAESGAPMGYGGTALR